MTTRADVVAAALRDDGYLDGAGFNVSNKFSAALGHGAEAWCGDFVTCKFKEAGAPLPPHMDDNLMPSGFSYCPGALAYGRGHGIVVNSWQSQPADILLADWDNDGIADHTELVVGYDGTNLHTIGGNSGIWHEERAYLGRGGVHRHYWPTRNPSGNDMIIAVLDAGRLVRFGAPTKPSPTPLPPGPQVPPFPGRLLMLASPEQYGEDVRTWQRQMAHRSWSIGVDGWYGPQSQQVCRQFQAEKRLEVDGRVGQVTWSVSFTAPVT